MKLSIPICVLFFSIPAVSAPVASGKLVLSKELSVKAKGIRTVFITVKDPKAAMPMPCAAQKFTLTKDAEGDFLTFSLETGSLMMMACQEIPEMLNLKAKLDKDGSAGPDSSGDLVGTLNGIKKGSKNLKIELTKVIE